MKPQKASVRLSVAVDRHQAVEAVLDREIEGADEARSVPAVHLMPDHVNIGKGSEQLRRPVGRAVIHGQDRLGVPRDLAEDGLEVRFFVENGDRGQDSHEDPGAWRPTSKIRRKSIQISHLAKNRPSHSRSGEGEVNADDEEGLEGSRIGPTS